ncbi:type III pantothenate kinase [Simiduia aestuariiviva]|uniref:Type III pantothenate kinase n=1 Tax=Simiduia aestuariiviva TaxID=1510459 RepID=A0A839UUQ0_9GAMM|nr:type III pantothenate kinase [Simiduia aestuariiviva]MBB3170170.1 type III pantothenate kinase [Simiduia aestuariiviva]
MIVDIDCGNSRIKWRIAGVGTCGDCSWADFERAGVAALRLPVGPPERIRVASVAGATQRLALALTEAFGIEVERAQVLAGWDGLECGYHSPDRLGVDRWLAALAARRRWPNRPLVVVDAGTALTVDVLRADRFEGGFIGPGMHMMRASLFSGTAAVKVPELLDATPDAPARDTGAAVSGATYLMSIGLVGEVVARYAPDAEVVVTGGDGRRLAAALSGAHWVPHLVMDGLAVALP